jgi:hypothetical protein
MAAHGGNRLSYRRSALDPASAPGPILSCFKESRSFDLELAPALDGCQLLRTGVGVEKLEISENQYKFGERKCLGSLNKSFIGHPDAIYFLKILAK